MLLLGSVEFRILLNPIQLWPSLLVAIFIALIRIIVNHYFSSTANRITRQKIRLSKPEWLNKNLKTYNQIMKSMDALNEKEFAKLHDHAMNLHLTSHQIRALKSYFIAYKQFHIQSDKFLEATFKLIAIIPISLYGIYICYIRNDFFMNHWKQWIHFGDPVSDIQCDINYENEPLIQQYDDYILWYYIISFGYHLNRALTQFYNPKRKDFVALFIHHWVTLCLMVCSFVAGKLGTGCITLAIHEYSDIFLECGKLCQYTSFQLGADIFFVFFLLSWMIFRMYFFCYKLLYSLAVCGVYTIWLDGRLLFFAAVNIGFLYVLQGIHIYWLRLILKVIQNKLSGGQVSDVRSP
eukprot:UN00181